MEWQDAEMQDRKTEKDTALAEIAVVFGLLEQERRTPDHWERVCLIGAFFAIFSGCYGIATCEARLALTPVAERSPETRLPHDPIYTHCDLPVLMQIWQAAQAEPVHRFPHFGPIELKASAAGKQGISWLQPPGDT